jgi:predicted acetyltransferase
MIQHTRPPQWIRLTPATLEDRPVLSNLYQLYIHDFTDFVDLELGDDGRFTYDPLPPYWSERNRFPFLVKADGRLAGFALVKKGSDFSGNPEVWDIADFFVVRGARGQGVGYRVAEEIWRRFPGPWEVRVMITNAPALAFWTRAVSRFTGHKLKPDLITCGDETRYLFNFESKGKSAEAPMT